MAIIFSEIQLANKLNLTMPKYLFDFKFLKIDETKISSQPCFSLISISWILWAEPIILNSVGLLYIKE